MYDRELCLARRYARAVLAVCGDLLTADDIATIERAEHFFKTHRPVLHFLALPEPAAPVKREIVKKLFEQVHMPACVHGVVALLAKHKRLFLVPQVLASLVRLYRERSGIIIVRVESSSALRQEQMERIGAFLVKKTAKIVSCSYSVDKSLIAGIRMQSDTLLWEYSVRKKLRDMRMLALQ